MNKKITALATTMMTSAGFLQFATSVYAVANFTPVAAPTGYADNAGSLINFVLRLVLVIAALLVFLYLVLGGIEYITSGGEKGKTEAARNKITSAIVGLIILAASWAILNLALGFLGLGDLNSAINRVGDIKNPGQ